MSIFFDIETGPLPEAELLATMPPFDPADVKCGNLKDPQKIADKIAAAEANHKQDYIERAALNPMTGHVLAVGVVREGQFEILGHDDEAQLLTQWWALIGPSYGRQLVGFNICGFDLPFLIRRSWRLRVPVPPGLRARGRWWADDIVDLRDLWQLGDREVHGNLGAIATWFGVGGKNGDGAEFARLWREDRARAEAYLRNDLDMTVKVAAVLGVQ